MLAYFQGEPGQDLVTTLIERAAVDVNLNFSIINFGELAYITERERGMDESRRVLDDVRRMPIVLCDVTEQRVLAAAHIKAHHALSYADAFAASLAQELGATLVSGDPEFRSVRDLVPILWSV
jgi:ribonuclease VapC